MYIKLPWLDSLWLVKTKTKSVQSLKFSFCFRREREFRLVKEVSLAGFHPFVFRFPFGWSFKRFLAAFCWSSKFSFSQRGNTNTYNSCIITQHVTILIASYTIQTSTAPVREQQPLLVAILISSPAKLISFLINELSVGVPTSTPVKEWAILGEGPKKPLRTLNSYFDFNFDTCCSNPIVIFRNCSSSRQLSSKKQRTYRFLST